MFTQTPQQVPPSHAFPVDTRNFKCIFFLGFKMKYFCAFAQFIVWILLRSLATDIVDPNNEGAFGGLEFIAVCFTLPK